MRQSLHGVVPTGLRGIGNGCLFYHNVIPTGLIMPLIGITLCVV
jgi:hypothetical protein